MLVDTFDSLFMEFFMINQVDDEDERGVGCFTFR